MADDLAGPVLSTYVDDVHTALDAAGRSVARIVVVAPGLAPAWDECCEGMLYSRVVSITPKVDMNLARGGHLCATLGWTVTAAIGVLRCAYVVNDRGQAPTPSQITSDGAAALADAADLLQVVLCHPSTASVQGWTPLGVEGGCHGGEVLFTFMIARCSCG